MKLKILFAFMILNFAGCNSLHKLYNTDSTKPEDRTLSVNQTVVGTISVQGQYINPIRCEHSSVTAQVKIPGATNFRDVNKYEMQCLGDGENGYVRFGDSEVVIVSPSQLVLTGRPVAPIGTQYNIRSVLN